VEHFAGEVFEMQAVASVFRVSGRRGFVGQRTLVENGEVGHVEADVDFRLVYGDTCAGKTKSVINLAENEASEPSSAT